jgi:hypothetical protein
VGSWPLQSLDFTELTPTGRQVRTSSSTASSSHDANVGFRSICVSRLRSTTDGVAKRWQRWPALASHEERGHCPPALRKGSVAHSP